MKKNFLVIAMLCMAVLFVFTACDKKDKEELEEVTIYGTVLFAEDGTPAQNAQIEVWKSYLSEEQQREDMSSGGTSGITGSTVTGFDGSYEFTIRNVNTKFSYVIIAKKEQYNEEEMTLSLNNIKSGGKLRCDFQLRRDGGMYK